VTRAADLRHLADRIGVVPAYHDMLGNQHPTSSDTQEALAEALGFPCAGPTGPRDRLAEIRAAEDGRLLEPVAVHVTEAPPTAVAVRLRVPPGHDGPVAWELRLRLEDGECTVIEGGRRRAGGGPLRLPLPDPLAWGYHRLDGAVCLNGRAHDVRQLLIVAPGSCMSVGDRLGEHRAFGIVANLYGIRSARNWGAGDFGDLRALVRRTAGWRGGFVGINPLHAIANTGVDVSPYSPLSRVFGNPLYLEVDAVPEARAAGAPATDAALRDRVASLRAGASVDYEAVAVVKRAALATLHARFQRRGTHQPAARRVRAYREFCRRHGDALERFATFMALAERHGADWRRWPAALHAHDAPAVEVFRRAHPDAVDVQRYLQFEFDRQLGAVGGTARTTLAVGLVGDLALGSAPGGADPWSFPGLFATGTRLGAPPDDYSATGQDWGLPPVRPEALRETGFAYWIAVVRSAMRHVGAIRIDHVMGLFRQFWIPPDAEAPSGAYVRFPETALLAILALESRRHGVLVVGEDLGTVPRGFSRTLARRGILSTRVLYFERDARGRFKAPRAYSPRALATVTTHDLPPLAGFWRGTDLDLRERIESLPPERVARARAERATAKERLRARLDTEGLPLGDDPAPERLAGAVYGFLARTPAPLVGIALDDLTGETVPVNLPGVATDRYPSWTRRNQVPLERLARFPVARAVLTAVTKARPPTPPGRV